MITLDGEPLVSGSVVFVPMNPDLAVAVNGAHVNITSGQYSVTGGVGLLPGEYKVQIQSQMMIDKKTGKPILGGDKPEDPFSYEVKNLVPEKYNTQTEIVFTVDEKKGAKVFDYDVKTK